MTQDGAASAEKHRPHGHVAQVAGHLSDRARHRRLALMVAGRSWETTVYGWRKSTGNGAAAASPVYRFCIGRSRAPEPPVEGSLDEEKKPVLYL